MLNRLLLLVLVIVYCLLLVDSSPVEPSEYSWLRSKRQYWRYGGFGTGDGTGSTWENAYNGGLSLFGK